MPFIFQTDFLEFTQRAGPFRSPHESRVPGRHTGRANGQTLWHILSLKPQSLLLNNSLKCFTESRHTPEFRGFYVVLKQNEGSLVFIDLSSDYLGQNKDKNLNWPMGARKLTSHPTLSLIIFYTISLVLC